MPNRIAMGAVAWWEPVLAVGLTLAGIVALAKLGGRVYAHAILHGGPTLRLRDVWSDVWRGTTAPPVVPPGTGSSPGP
jgi:ABC-2 type transport system permease protein